MATILKTDKAGTFKVKVSIGNTRDGSRRYKTKVMTGATTRTIGKLAAEWEAEVRATEAAGLHQAEPAADETEEGDLVRPTFLAVLREYLDTAATRKGWSDRYRGERERAYREIEATPLASVVMSDLRGSHLTSHLAAYADTPSENGRTHGDASCRHRRVLLSAACRYAVAHPDIDVRGNPAENLSTPDATRTVAERDIPTVAGFLQHIETACDLWAPIVAGDMTHKGFGGRVDLTRDLATFAVLSGLRRAELCGLQSRDVTHLPDGRARVHVRRTVARVPGGSWKTDRTKTRQDRTITVNAGAASLLLRRQVANDTLAMTNDVRPLPEAFIFSTGWGEVPIMPGQVTRWWNVIRGLVPALDDLRLQDLRHAHASELHATGLHAAAVAAHMGHTTAVSLRTYDHVRPNASAAMADALDAALAGVS
jgi:integrase